MNYPDVASEDWERVQHTLRGLAERTLDHYASCQAQRNGLVDENSLLKQQLRDLEARVGAIEQAQRGSPKHCAGWPTELSAGQSLRW